MKSLTINSLWRIDVTIIKVDQSSVLLRLRIFQIPTEI